jgi:hypothetical protein
MTSMAILSLPTVPGNKPADSPDLFFLILMFLLRFRV